MKYYVIMESDTMKYDVVIQKEHCKIKCAIMKTWHEIKNIFKKMAEFSTLLNNSIFIIKYKWCYFNETWRIMH